MKVAAALIVLVAGTAPVQAQHEGHTAPPPTAHEQHAPAAAGPTIPPLTDADRAAAFPDLGGMSAQQHMAAAPRGRLLLERLEWQDARAGDAWGWDLDGWYGGDFERVWLRSEGLREDGSTRDADLELFYGRAFSRWWEFVAGARQDFGAGPSRSWAALGVQGLAPYMVHLEATGYLGDSGRTALRLEARQELRLLQRVILQPLLELDLHGRDDPQAGIGSGLSTVEAGLRLRYEIRREFAPYVGVSWQRHYGDTADFARASGEEVEDTRLVAGLRVWF